MSLNTFWKQRTDNALKTRSEIAATAHWSITSYVIRDGRNDAVMNYAFTPACKLPRFLNATVLPIAWDAGPFGVRVVDEIGHVEHTPVCKVCESMRLAFVRAHGLGTFRRGNLY